MTSGRRTVVSSASSARSRSAPSAVRVAAGPPAVTVGGSAGGRAVPAWTCHRRRRATRSGTGTTPPWGCRTRSAAAARHGPPRHRRPARRRRASAAGRPRPAPAAASRRAPSLALAGRPPQVRERQDDVAVRQRRSLGLGHRGRERRQQRVLVLFDGVGRRPPDPGGGSVAQRVEPVPARVRPAVAEHGPLHRRDPAADRRLVAPM